MAARGKNLLKNVPVTGTLEDGGTFRGKLTITGMGYNKAGPNQGLTVSGVVQGVATTADGTQRHVKQAFTDVRATLNERGSAGGMSTQQAVCDILFLNLGPLHLDLLGLTVICPRSLWTSTRCPERATCWATCCARLRGCSIRAAC